LGRYIYNPAEKEKTHTNLKIYQLLLIAWLYNEDKRYPYDISELTGIIKQKIATSKTNTKDDIAAAKSLLIHHAHELINLDNDNLSHAIAELNNSKKFNSLLGQLAKNQNHIRQGLTPSKKNNACKRIKNKYYQGIMATKNIASGRIGISLPTKKRLKVAVCISGQLRGYHKTFHTWKKSFLADIDHDIFVHSWSNIGGSGAEPFRSTLPFDGVFFQQGYRECCMTLGFDQVKQKYPTLFEYLHHSDKVNEEQIQKFYGAHSVILEDDKEPRFKSLSNSEKMHYKIKSCHDLMQSTNTEYDLVIRARPDLPISFIGFNWSDVYNWCNSEPIIFTDDACGVHYMNYMMGDQFAVGKPDTMSIYSNTYTTYSTLSENKIFACKEELAGHLSLGMTCWSNNINIKKLPLKKGALLNPKLMSTTSISEAIKTDAKGRNSHWDKKLLQLLLKDATLKAAN
jgi:hypothetical protein